MRTIKCLARFGAQCCTPHIRKYSNKKKVTIGELLKDAATFEEKHYDKTWATEPYPYIPTDKPKPETGIDPREASIILFPGQGTQYLGMGTHLFKYPGVKDLYDCASDIVGFDLAHIQTKDELNKYCQVSIVVASLAAVEQLRDERPSVIPSCVATAGFSLGEITALIFAGSIPFEQGIRLVNIRAMAMEASSQVYKGGMLTIMYGAGAKIKDLIEDAVAYSSEKMKIENSVCKIANYLYPHCCILSGNEEALNFVEKKAKDYGVRKFKRINVSGAFHSDLMKDAIEPVREALKSCILRPSDIPVYSGTDNKMYRTPEDIIREIPKQITKTLKWEQLMHLMYSRAKGMYFPQTFEVGPGNTLRSILRQVNARAWDNSFSIRA